MKKLLLLGGNSNGSCDIVNYAKSIGVYTIVADYLSKDLSLAKQICDESWDISTNEIDEICLKAKNENVSAVFAGISDFNIDCAQKICKKLKLPFYASKEQLDFFSDKAKYLSLFENFGLPRIREYSLDFGETGCRKKILFPVIIKPTDSSSGNGISICNNESELNGCIEHALIVSKSKSFLIEQYINSPEVTIFYIIRNGIILLSAMADRETYSFSNKVIPLPVMYRFPSIHLEEYQQQYDEKVKKALKSTGIQNGMIFLQAFWYEKKCYIYDVGFRLTGTQEYKILETVCGFNPLKMLVDYAITGEFGSKDLNFLVNPYFCGKKIAIVTLLVKPGKISKIIGVDKIIKMQGVKEFKLNHQENTMIPKDFEGTLKQVIARVYLLCDSSIQIEKIKKEIYLNFSVLDEYNHDIMIRP